MNHHILEQPSNQQSACFIHSLSPTLNKAGLIQRQGAILCIALALALFSFLPSLRSRLSRRRVSLFHSLSHEHHLLRLATLRCREHLLGVPGVQVSVLESLDFQVRTITEPLEQGLSHECATRL